MKRLNTLPALIFTAFILTSCNAYFGNLKTRQADGNVNKKYAGVLKMYTSTDGMVNFSKKYPGVLYNGEITGVKQVPLKLFKSDSVVYKIRKERETPLFVYSNGRKFEVFKNDQLDFVYTSTLINVPVSEVTNVEFKQEGSHAVVFAGLVTGLSALSVYIISNMTSNAGNAF